MSKLPGINISSFDHVTIICADLEATRRFYVAVLGMTEVPRPAFGFPGAWFQIGNVQIHATQEGREAGKAGWGDQGVTVVSRGHHFAFAVDNVSEALEIARSHGVRIASPLQVRPDGFKQAYLYDPDGHVVEIVSG
jgi:catechol 2,3-dioxygenase-like lactoylglutathione lyase family enzyme